MGGLAATVGGRPGSHARLGERRFWTPVRWLVLITLLTSLLGFWQKSPCRVHPWAEEYQYTRLCYTDVFALYFAERLNEGKTPLPRAPGRVPGRHRRRHGGGLAGRRGLPRRPAAAPLLRRHLGAAHGLRRRGVGHHGPAGRTATGLGRRDVRRCPGLLLHGTHQLGPRRHRPRGARDARLGAEGAGRRRRRCSGVATATKLYPVLFLVPLLALCWRAGKLGAWLRAAVATGVTGLLLVVPGLPGQPVVRRRRRHPDAGRRQPARPVRRRGPGGADAARRRAEPHDAGRDRPRHQRRLPLRRAEPDPRRRLGLALLRGLQAAHRGRLPAQHRLDLVQDTDQPPGEPPRVLNRAVAVTLPGVPAGDRRAGAAGAAPAAGAAAAVPHPGRVLPHQQGVQPAVRHLAAPARPAGPAALAPVPALAGHRGRGPVHPRSTSSSATTSPARASTSAGSSARSCCATSRCSSTAATSSATCCGPSATSSGPTS